METKVGEIVSLTEGFLSSYQKLILETVIPYQESILMDKVVGAEKSHAIENFRIAAGLVDGDFYGMVFQDSDVAKWIEGVAYALRIRRNRDLEERVDDVISIIELAQEDDGYLNTYFSIKSPHRKWQNLQECHELYCAGHMMEAAVAYYSVTGKDKLLQVAIRLADHIDSRFGINKELGVPGHQEIELGLMALYDATGEIRYRDLAGFFLKQRGRDPDYFLKEKEKRAWVHFDMDPNDHDYFQCSVPVYEQDKAVGHSVRAVYMYTAMAKWAEDSGDLAMLAACKSLWDNIVNCQMYITGAIGSSHIGESFTFDYDLPNDTAYAETCASIGLVFFAKAMLKHDKNSEYGDVIERALYNGILSGMSQDGHKFFYVNPLEVNPGISGVVNGHKHVLAERPNWYKCACCPPNLVRMITYLNDYIWSIEQDTIYCHLYTSSQLKAKDVWIDMETTYPLSGDITIDILNKNQDLKKVAFRLPDWVDETIIKIEGIEIDLNSISSKGYAYINLKREKTQITIKFSIKIRKIYCHPKVVSIKEK